MALCALTGGSRQRRSKRSSAKLSAGAVYWGPDYYGVAGALPARVAPPFEKAVKKPSNPQSRLLVEKSEDSEDADGSDSSSDIGAPLSKQQRGALILARFIEKGSLKRLLGRPRPRVSRGKGSRPRRCFSRGEGSRRSSRGGTPPPQRGCRGMRGRRGRGWRRQRRWWWRW